MLWADANESEQTVISYLAHDDPEHPGADRLGPRASSAGRRTSRPRTSPPSTTCSSATSSRVKLEFWNWKNLEWQDTWDTTQSDGQKGWLPSRVRITVTTKDPNGKDIKLTTQARILMQEPLNFAQ